MNLACEKFRLELQPQRSLQHAGWAGSRPDVAERCSAAFSEKIGQVMCSTLPNAHRRKVRLRAEIGFPPGRVLPLRRRSDIYL